MYTGDIEANTSSLSLQIKADRGDVEASDETISQLQKETQQLANKEREGK